MEQQTLNLILKSVNEVKADVKEIKSEVWKINNRIKDLEEDRKYFWKVICYFGTAIGILAVALKVFNVF